MHFSTLGSAFAAQDGVATTGQVEQFPPEGRTSGESGDGDRGNLVGGGSCGGTPSHWVEQPQAHSGAAEPSVGLRLGSSVPVGAKPMAGVAAVATQPKGLPILSPLRQGLHRGPHHECQPQQGDGGSGSSRNHESPSNTFSLLELLKAFSSKIQKAIVNLIVQSPRSAWSPGAKFLKH